MGLATINPDSDSLIEIISVGHPVSLEGSTGWKLAEGIKSSMDNLNVHPKQIISFSCDGVYLQRNVQTHLEEQWQVKKNSIPLRHDPMHRLGLVDKHLTGICLILDWNPVQKMELICKIFR